MERTTVAERKAQYIATFDELQLKQCHLLQSRTTATTALAAAEVELEQLRKKVKDTEEQLNSEVVRKTVAVGLYLCQLSVEHVPSGPSYIRAVCKNYDGRELTRGTDYCKK